MTPHHLRILVSPYFRWARGNPHLGLLYEAIKKHNVEVSDFAPRKLWRGTWHVWHLHWPEGLLTRDWPEYLLNSRVTFVRLLRFYVILKLARTKKIKIFWTAHNVRPHERDHPLLERLFWRIFLPNLDGIICFSEPGKKQLFAEHPRTKSIPTFVIPRGHYRGAYPDTMSKSEAREALKIHAHEFIILFFGQIRRYKGVGRLIKCFARAQISCAQLLIAGRPMGDVIRREINDAAAQSPHVRLFLDFVDQNDIQKFFRAADLVVLPYKEISNSGSAILALSFDRPVLLPMLGALPGLQQIGSDWVKLYKGELTPEIISDAINWTKRRHLALGARAPLEDFNWDHTAQATIRAFKFTVDCCDA